MGIATPVTHNSKMNIVLIVASVIPLLILTTNGIQGRQNSTVKTIHTRHGDIYDCIDFYKQPAFDHPLLKNQTFSFQNNPSLPHEKARNKLGLSGGGCPSGTVPIRRVTKANFIRVEPVISQSTTNDKPASTHDATCGAQSDSGYSGLAASFAVYNPTVNNDKQYSAAKIKLQIGPDSIEAGWRVDPKLYGDTKTRLYIRTDAGDAHCFNALCSGFVITDRSIPLDLVLQPSGGGKILGFHMSIAHDQPTGGNWILRVGISNTAIGYWSNNLFRQPGLADSVEWGGETFGAENTANPGMGASDILKFDTTKDAFFSNIQVMNGPISGGQAVDPVNVKCDSDTHVFDVKNEGNVGGEFQYLTFYGGPPCYNCS